MRQLLLVLLLLGASPASAEVDSPWEPLGPAEGERATTATAVAPLANGVILLLAGEHVLRRALDGSWSEVLSGGRGTYLAASRGARLLAVAVLGDELFASLDGGQSWGPTGLPGTEPRLDLSPAFEADGAALYQSAGRLFQTHDGGLTWAERVPVQGQRVQQALFSPAYAEDRTLVAAVVSGGFPKLVEDQPGGEPASENEESAGVLVSRDGGDTWAPPVSGPSLDGASFRHVYTLALSPGFGLDRTLFAYAWGPRTPGSFMGGGLARQWQGALFRSRDAGATWEAVQTSGPPAFVRAYPTLALSPSFRLDDTLFLAIADSSVSPASAGCRVLRSVDAGGSWREVVPHGSYEGCLALIVSPRFPDDRVVLTGKMSWTVSPDGGLSWAALGSPAESPNARPVFGPDYWLYVVRRAGAWRRPPFTDRTDRPACLIQPAGGFGRLWRANDGWRGDLGCPSEGEQRVVVPARASEEMLYLRPSAESGWYALGPGGDLRAVEAVDVPDTGRQELELVRQGYAGGVLLWDTGAPARIVGLDVMGGRWREFPDLR